MLRKIAQRIAFGKASYNPVEYWSRRASDPETMSVMWENTSYNELVDRDEWDVIRQHFSSTRDSCLDIGCGTGRLSQRLAREFRSYTGVDMAAMVEEARRRNPSLADRYVAATLDEYSFPVGEFDFVLSLGCISTACSKEMFFDELAPRIAQTLRSRGKLLLIEPFHKHWLLTRGCKTTGGEVTSLFEGLGLSLDHKDAMLFPPLRMMLAEKVFEPFPRTTKLVYRAGEALVHRVPALADYAVLAFSKG